MADAWGGAWGLSWGASWGSGDTPPPTPETPPELGGGPIKGVRGPTATQYSRERHRELRAEIDRVERATAKLRKKKIRDAKRREQVREAVEEANDAIAIIEERLDASFLVGLQALAAALETALAAQKQIDVYAEAVEAMRHAQVLKDLALRVQDEEDILALMLS